MNRHIHFLAIVFIVQMVLFFSVFNSDAHAYLGPGAGLGLIGSLFAAIVVVLVIIFGLILYPIRRLKNRGKRGKGPDKD